MSIGNIGSVESGQSIEIVGENKITISGIPNLQIDTVWNILDKKELPSAKIQEIESAVEMINSGISSQSENIVQTGWNMLVELGAETIAKIVTGYMIGK